MNKKTRFVFFGSGPVAASSLELLLQDFEVEAIITKPTTKTEMEAVAKDIPVHTVSNKVELSELFAEHAFKSRLGVLIDFGIIVSQSVIDYFEFGIVNSHFSILPELRGADPISFAILEGREKTGVSLMLLVQAMDEGPLLITREIAVTDTDTSIELSTKLVQLSHELLVEALPKYLAGQIKPEPQDTSKTAATYTRKLTKQDGVLDFQKSAINLEREIRAFIEWPKSKAKLGEVDVVITKAYAVETESPNLVPGNIEIVTDLNLLSITTKSGYLYIEKLKPVGKNEMDSRAFLAGYKSRLNLDQ